MGVKKIQQVIFITKPVNEIIEEIESNDIKYKTNKVLEMLIENEYIPTNDIMNFWVCLIVFKHFKKKAILTIRG